MNCNCIKEKETALIGQIIGHKKVTRAEVISGVLSFENFKFLSTSEVRLTFDGVNKKRVIPLAHAFCPFCGVKINNP
jgi:hypothetical protein